MICSDLRCSGRPFRVTGTICANSFVIRIPCECYHVMLSTARMYTTSCDSDFSILHCVRN